MQKIKFRAIYEPFKDTKDGYLMFYQEIIDLDVWFICEKDPDIGYPFTAPWTDDGWTLMQYIWLKDKSGIEIYEGDIVDVNGTIYVCQWDECYMGFGFFSGPVTSLGGYSYPEMQIVGNIYENPELLEESND